ncbi:GNAT family N-acetyltransferase [Spirillospora sp. NPDC127200]
MSYPTFGDSTTKVEVDDGSFLVRPVVRGDEQAIARLHDDCSLLSRYHRYFVGLSQPTELMVEQMTDRRHGLHLGVERPSGRLMALAGLTVTDEPGTAEITLLVGDPWQGKGLGAQLTGHLVQVAREAGLTRLRAHALADNHAVHRIAARVGAQCEWEPEDLRRQVELVLLLDALGSPDAP